FAGSVVGGFAALALLALALTRSGFLRQAVTADHFHDLGKLLFTFMVFWSYIAFCQFFLIWYANIPEETGWFLHRLDGGWRSMTLLLVFGHFVVPFFFLMPRTIKRRRPLLMVGAVWMLLVHFLDLHWLIIPAMSGAGSGRFLLLELTALVGIGGVALAVVGWLLAGAPLVPLRDPRLLESMAFENS
ncbi:MAG TPA: quinol:cytochrome C oxidoreductase, partial [Thermoanaerobaculia bacterium]|nr:quinol:cytochrome C oxidoreductase [Thermoanaerobaculia bacterium]